MSEVIERNAERDLQAVEKLNATYRAIKSELAKVIVEIAHSRVTGLWHVAGAECVSRFELGAKVASVLGYSESMLIPRTIEEGDCTPPRARNSTLNIDKIRALLNFPFATIETNLRHEYGQ